MKRNVRSVFAVPQQGLDAWWTGKAHPAGQAAILKPEHENGPADLSAGPPRVHAATPPYWAVSLFWLSSAELSVEELSAEVLSVDELSDDEPSDDALSDEEPFSRPAS